MLNNDKKILLKTVAHARACVEPGAKGSSVWLPCGARRSEAWLLEPGFTRDAHPPRSREQRRELAAWRVAFPHERYSSLRARPSAAPPIASRAKVLTRDWEGGNLQRLACMRPRKPPPGLPGAVSVPEPRPRWSRLQFLPRSREEPRLGRKGSWQEGAAPQGHGWLLRTARR